MSIRHAVTVVAFASAIVSHAASNVDSQCVTALQKALCSSATWTMERRFSESVRALVSTGTVDCVVGTGIQWRVLHPFPSSVEMTVDSMIFEDEDGRCVKKLADMPYYSVIREKSDAFARGDTSAFDELFEMSSSVPDCGGWVLTMKPKQSAMRRLFTSVELSGDQTFTNAVLRAGDGGVSTIRFMERPRDK